MLEGIRVVDASHHLAGPFCGQRLGDLGAEVIKVEPPGGEWGRRTMLGTEIAGTSTGFMSINRNKRGMSLNLKAPAGRAILLELVESADVFIVNMRPAVVDRLGLGYDALAERNPRLVYAQVSGWGPRGPQADKPGQDLLVQAFSGLTMVTGSAHDPPIPAGAAIVDVSTSYLATIGILAALFERTTSGRGRKVEVDLLRAAIDLQAPEFTILLNNDVDFERAPYRLGMPAAAAPYGIHRTDDGWIAIAYGPYPAFAEALGEPRLAAFTEWDDGYRHRGEIYEIVAQRVATAASSHWLEVLERHGIWCSKVNRPADVLAEAHLGAIGHFRSVPDPHRLVDVTYVGLPVTISGFEPTVRRHAPELGQHTAEILGEMGRTPLDIDELRAAGVI